MTLKPFDRPFAQYASGQPIERKGHRSGLSEGRIYRAGNVVGVMHRRPHMPAPAFNYYPNLLAGWKAYKHHRQVAA